ncbi:MAG: hypothetical protein IPH38_18530 [Candidatus Microthrix sp.]|nr:hypothetical protein [Candidatus Microthrix sp.]
MSSDQATCTTSRSGPRRRRLFRRAFVPAPGYRLCVANYNQIGLRCIAHLSQDPGLVGAFTAGDDIHAQTAARIFEVDADEVSIAQRSTAKMVSYGLAYRHEGYRPGPATVDSHRRAPGHPGRLLRGLPQRSGLYGRGGRRRPGKTTPRRCSAAPSDSRACLACRSATGG